MIKKLEKKYKCKRCGKDPQTGGIINDNHYCYTCFVSIKAMLSDDDLDNWHDF